MRVGILTFHWSRNYGALLQAYGLRRAIESLGHDATVLHYIPEHCYNDYMSPIETSWVRLGWRTYGPRLAIERRMRTYRFNRFKRKALCLSKRCNDKEDLVQQVAELDALVVGSDQVWNLHFAKSEDLCYFIDFQRQHELLCISYAACCGQKDQPSTYLPNVPSMLANFHSISVRNDVTADFVKSLTNLDATIVADPTILVNYDALEDRYIPDSKYILAYVLEKKSFPDYSKIIIELKKKLGLPVWVIGDGNAQWKDVPFLGADRNWFGTSPGRVLSLIKHATCVVTDSFHGTIFSVKYKKPFITLNDGEGRNMRMLDLAKRYGISNRITSIYDMIDHRILLQTEDLIPILEKFDTHKAVSYEFLKNSFALEISA